MSSPWWLSAKGCVRAGHEVQIATFGSFRPLVESAGLPFAPLAGAGQALTDSEEGRAMLESGENIVKHIRAIRAISRKLLETEGYWESFDKACANAEAIIYHYTAPQDFTWARNSRSLPSLPHCPLRSSRREPSRILFGPASLNLAPL